MLQIVMDFSNNMSHAFVTRNLRLQFHAPSQGAPLGTGADYPASLVVHIDIRWQWAQTQ